MLLSNQIVSVPPLRFERDCFSTILCVPEMTEYDEINPNFPNPPGWNYFEALVNRCPITHETLVYWFNLCAPDQVQYYAWRQNRYGRLSRKEANKQLIEDSENIGFYSTFSRFELLKSWSQPKTAAQPSTSTEPNFICPRSIGRGGEILKPWSAHPLPGPPILSRLASGPTGSRGRGMCRGRAKALSRARIWPKAPKDVFPIVPDKHLDMQFNTPFYIPLGPLYGGWGSWTNEIAKERVQSCSCLRRPLSVPWDWDPNKKEEHHIWFTFNEACENLYDKF